MLQEGWQYGSKEYEDSARDAPCQSRISYAFRIQFLFVALDSVADVVASDEELLVDLVAADCGGIIRVEIAEMCIDVGLRGGREFFITGHSEYSPGTLDFEYHRDLEKGLNPAIPANYYLNDDPTQQPIVRWRSHANLLFSNWLNYFVYQETPYDIREIK